MTQFKEYVFMKTLIDRLPNFFKIKINEKIIFYTS